MKWSQFVEWHNDTWNPGANYDNLPWEYDESKDALKCTSNYDGFNGVVNKQYLSWDDYAIETVVSVENAEEDDGIGLSFRWQDKNNYYFFLMDRGGLNWGFNMTLGKVVDGVLHYLPSSGSVSAIHPHSWIPYKKDAFCIKVIGNNIRVWVNGVLQYDVNDSSFPYGTFGPLTISQPDVYFSDFKAYLLPIQAFVSGIGDMDDCLVVGPKEQTDPLRFYYGTRTCWNEEKHIDIYPKIDFSYMVWAKGNIDVTEELDYHFDMAAYPKTNIKGILTANADYPATFSYTLSNNVDHIVKDNGLADIVWVIDASESMGPYAEKINNYAESFLNNLNNNNIDYNLSVLNYKSDAQMRIKDLPESLSCDIGETINDYFTPKPQFIASDWINNGDQFKELVGSIDYTGSEDRPTEDGIKAISYALSNYDFREHSYVTVITFADKGVSDYDADTIAEIVDKINAEDGVILGIINPDDALGYLDDGIVTGDYADINSEWPDFNINARRVTMVQSEFNCYSLALSANNNEKKVSLVVDQVAEQMMMPLFPIDTLYHWDYGIKTDCLGVYLSVGPDGSAPPMGWADSKATHFSGLWNLNFDTYAHEGESIVGCAADFLPVNQGGRIHPGKAGITYELTKGNSLGEIYWQGTGAPGVGELTDYIIIKSDIVYYGEDISGNIICGATKKYKLPVFKDINNEPMPERFVDVQYILRDLARGTVYYSFESNPNYTTNHARYRIITGLNDDTLMIQTPVTDGIQQWLSLPYRGYASLNGQEPMIDDNDGYYPIAISLPNLDIPSEVINLEYMITWISDDSIEGYFESTGSRITSFDKDRIVFKSDKMGTRSITVPCYSEEEIHEGIIEPDGIYTSTPFALGNGIYLTASPCTSGVLVWVEGNVVYAKATVASIFGEWHPLIHAGHYAIGEKQYYLFAQKIAKDLDLSQGYSLEIMPYPQQGAPVILTGERGNSLREISFVDDGSRFTLYNTEYFDNLDTDIIYLMYKDINNIEVNVNGHSVSYAVIGNRIKLAEKLDKRDKLVVRYILNNSFCLEHYSSFARQQRRIADIPQNYSIGKYQDYTIFDCAYVQ